MLTYALIALGGAIGSVARAWLATTFVALTGPAFPWGTILINIIGSFVIGFFGTLTATDGRFAVPFDARAFVMVGICGGFTTFSSFSLQTLELVRDGRAGQALGNILLSVVLCLVGVAAGYALAMTARTSRFSVIGAALPGTLATSTLVALHRPEAVEGMLAIARQLMRHEDGRVTALAIDGPELAALQPTEEVMSQERRKEMSAKRADWVDGMRSRLDRWASEEQEAGHPARWIEVRGDGALAVAEHGRNAHLLLLEQRPGDPDTRTRVHAALRRAGRPVLLVPTGNPADLGHTVAVAWHHDGPVRAAVRTAYPLLSHAGRIVVLGIGETIDERSVADLLEGLKFDLVQARAEGRDVGRQLLRMAHEAGADLLVMGSSSRGKLRDKLFDSVTDSVLRTADLPVLIQHQGS